MTADPLTDAAARTLVAERCQRAYLHEVRGGLQALSGAFELLARLARTGDCDAAVVDRAAMIAKRALANHESAMLDMIKQITAASDRAERIDLGALLEDVLRFLRNDFAGRQIQSRLERGEEVCVEAVRNQLRFMLLGLLAGRLDACPTGGELAMHLTRRDGSAVLVLDCARGGSARAVQVHAAAEEKQPQDLVLDLVQHWLEAHGGRLVRLGGTGALEVILPLRA